MGLYRVGVLVVSLIVASLMCGCGKPEGPEPGKTSAPKAAPKPVKSLRASICLNGEWDFAPVMSDAQKAAPPKEGWRKVRVPSVWYRVPIAPGSRMTRNYEFDLPDDVAKAKAAWYRLNFILPQDWNDGRRVALEFEGVNYQSRIFVNGESTEENTGGHIPIRVDLTKRARFGLPNEVCVLVESESAEDGTPLQPVAGLWRSVYLRTCPPTSIGQVSVFTSVRKKEISLKVWLRNESEETRRLLLKNIVREWGTDRGVTVFGDLDVRLEPGESKEVEVKRAWATPKLWGFGEYGEPFLYVIRTELRAADSDKSDAGATLDMLNTRFGFREFWTSGKQFMFNGKPFFIKGDVMELASPLVHNRGFITLYYQAARAANINFIRLKDLNGFSPSVWYDVADELGMLVEPQAVMRIQKESGEIQLPDDERFDVLRNEWAAFIQREGNHPSIVMYSCDDGACTQKDEAVEGPVFARLHDLHLTLRLKDPTRLIEESGDVQLGTAARLGIFGELQVWNVHLGGAPVGSELEELKKKYDYSGAIPIHVGALGVGEKDPFNAWTRPAEILRRKSEMFQAWKAAGEYLAQSIKDAKGAGAAGMSIASSVSTMFFGPKSAEEMQFGPWDIRNTDESFDDAKVWEGKGRPVNLVFVKPRWPSLSGEGIKVCWIDASTFPLSAASQFNWFDPSRPPYLTNMVYDLVKKAFHDVDGKDAPPLAAQRAGEIVVGLAPEGKPIAGIFIFLTRKGQEAAGNEGVMTDASGTAWFVVREPGEYQAWAMVDGKRYSSEVKVSRSEVNSKPGYAHITWIDLTPGATTKVKADLSQPAVIEIREKVEKPQNTPPTK